VTKKEVEAYPTLDGGSAKLEDDGYWVRYDHEGVKLAQRWQDCEAFRKELFHPGVLDLIETQAAKIKELEK